MSHPNFDDMLNTCLDLLQQGASVNDCLERFPDAQAELRPILELTAQMNLIEFEPPSIPAFRKGRNRLKTAVQTKQTKTSGFGWVENFSAGMGLWFASLFNQDKRVGPLIARTAFASLLLAFSLFFSVNASADSLPGDMLYPVKTLSQQARIRLTPPEQRSAVVAQVSASRVADLDAILNDKERKATVTIYGPATIINDDIIMVEGFEIWLTQETVKHIEFEETDVVEVTVAFSNGVLSALQIDQSDLDHDDIIVTERDPEKDITPEPVLSATPDATPSIENTDDADSEPGDSGNVDEPEKGNSGDRDDNKDKDKVKNEPNKGNSGDRDDNKDKDKNEPNKGNSGDRNDNKDKDKVKDEPRNGNSDSRDDNKDKDKVKNEPRNGNSDSSNDKKDSGNSGNQDEYKDNSGSGNDNKNKKEDK